MINRSHCTTTCLKGASSSAPYMKKVLLQHLRSSELISSRHESSFEKLREKYKYRSQVAVEAREKTSRSYERSTVVCYMHDLWCELNGV